MNQQYPEEVSLGNSAEGGNIEAVATTVEEEEEVQQQQKQEEIESRDPIEEKPLEKSVDGEKEDDNNNMEVDPVSPATVFCVKLKQPNSNLLHKMSVPELCRNFRFDSFSIDQSF